jgi:ferric-dicitrate binding protein FerR (iron transport regulator)
MNASSNIPEALIARYVSGEAIPSEVREVEEWAALSDENERELQAFKSAWEKSISLQQPTFDSKAAWLKVKVRIQQQPNIEEKIIPLKQKSSFTFWRVAAGLALLVTIGALLVWFIPRAEVIQHQSADAFKEITLPDSSTVILAPHSTLSYSSDFGKKQRETQLDGEAFFDVKRNVSVPFSVQGGEANVKVLGTSFSVNTRNAQAILIKVSSGKVLVSDGEHTQADQDSLAVMLLPGHAATFAGKGKAIHTFSSDANKNRFAFDKTLVFENSELKAVCEVLTQVFGSSIRYKNEAIAHCRLTATFKNQELPAILHIIADTFGLTIEQQQNTYELNGEGC